MEWDIDKPYLWKNCVYATFCLVAMCFSLKSIAQEDTIIIQAQSSIKGRLFDSTKKTNCISVVVALLQKDSTLQVFTRSQKNGTFYLDRLVPGRYSLLFTHPGYNEYSFSIILKDGEHKDMGNMTLPPKSDLLTAVTVTPSAVNPHMRGDTLEYNVGHLQIKPNATVEEMLKRLPGVQVDRFGKITVNGQPIERLLVDGEDFFSGDPKIVTRNFNADMINKVQVLDKKSKEAEFTGIDDGQKTKTLNLTLKEDSKKGYFGKAEAGADLDDHYSINGLLGSFKNKRQFAALAMDVNNGGWGFSDNSGQTRAGISIRASAADPLGASAGIGIPHVAAGGTHYANHWTKYDGHFSGDLEFGRLTTEPFRTSTIIQNLPNSLYSQQKKAASLNTQDQQDLSAQYEIRPDSLIALQMSFEGSRSISNNILNSTGESSFNDTIVNNTIQQSNSNVKNEAFRASLMWNIRGRKTKRSSFSVMGDISSQENLANGMLRSINTFYHPGGSQNYQDSIDQRKYIVNNGLTLNSRVGYGVFLGKAAKASASYGVSFNRSQSLQSSYAKGLGNYDVYIDTLSNHYENRIFSQSFGLNLLGNIKKMSYTAGMGINHFMNTQKDLMKKSSLRQTYMNFTPNLNLLYRFDATKELRLEYSGLTEQPSISQLQPVVNNNDPLHVTAGNPDLRPGFSHSFQANFSRVGVMSLYMGAKYNFMVNAFGARVITDSLGRQISQTVNVSGNYSAMLYMLLGNKFKKIDLDYSFGPIAYYTRAVNYVGSLLNHSDGYKVGADVGVNKYLAGKIGVGVHCLTTWFSYRSALNPNQQVQYWTINNNAVISVFFLQGFEINMMGDYAWQQKVNNLNKETSVFLWNSFISRNFFANRLNIRWQVNDILGQNKGISRNINSNTVSEDVYNVLGRYWMLSASFRFIHHH
jgi:hypothetical protein